MGKNKRHGRGGGGGGGGNFRGGGHGGGNNGNRNNQHGNNNNNHNNHGGGKKPCGNCGRTNHSTHECRAPPKNGQQNQNNKVHKKDKQNSQNRDQQKKICENCSLFGHETRNCMAKEVDEDERCPCGNIYHRSFNCPFDGDPEKRLEMFDQSHGKICVWCKHDGDGTHDFNECQEVKKFRIALKEHIKSQYEGILWCWHCADESHKTRSCKKPVADIGNRDWESKIDSIIREWTKKDMSLVGQVDTDEPDMDHPAAYYKAPHPADYKWCIYCQQFGDHFGNRNICDTTEFDRRTPTQYKGVEPKKPYVPNRDDEQPVVQNGFFGNNHVNVSPGTIVVPCELKPGCPMQHRFKKNVRPWGNDRVFCTRCKGWMRHPYQENAALQVGLPGYPLTALAHMKLLVKELGWIDEDFDGKKKKKMKYPRPSYAIPHETAVERWPETQPVYSDLGTIPEWEDDRPLFQIEDDGEVFFNKPGNHQPYFPPILIKLTKMDREIRDDPRYPINQAGRLGLQYCCLTCGTLGVVRDVEGDIVMANVDPACTVALGYGIPEFWGTTNKNMCKCLTVLGKEPNPGFIGWGASLKLR